MVKRADFETAKANHISKRNRRNKGEVVVFDPEAHKEWVTGFRKRKQQRRKAADKAQVEKDVRAKMAERKQKRTELKEAYDKATGKSVMGIVEEDDDKEGGKVVADEYETIRPFEGTVEYGNGTQVVVQAIGGDFSGGESASEEEEEEEEQEEQEKKPKKPIVLGEKPSSQPRPDEKKLLKALQLKKRLKKGNMKGTRNMDKGVFRKKKGISVKK
mmetsp:Transcript_41613/g.69532  ORF Transcript_41613/g.69532 Transcript_41613/m.69532 type:complete len:215 (-) Transcript_41613:88-732(-)|eukprot:CAMPEP_0198198360 /NCGR_PEP_ID=MMETSP1445-20131203/1842_1 /TAXON_ID=36898 /ORGANISM="Pyramimonas sp., Strain CCMP2087" /LENGTH=214 /DNA_ID=CAMNT_0043867905 /DNA_START=83 /DNA_END=727 /DNA_ORIENTATION=-